MTEDKKPRNLNRPSRAKLTARESECLEIIRAEHKQGGITPASIALRMGVTVHTVSCWCSKLNLMRLAHSTCEGRSSKWLPGAREGVETITMPVHFNRQIPSIFALGAML